MKTYPGLVGGPGNRIYSITATYAIALVGNYGASVRAVHNVLAQSSGGMMIVLSQNATYDPSGTGITVLAVPSGNDLNFQVLNTTTRIANVTCLLDWAEAAGP